MSANTTTASILIKEGALLPLGLVFETEPFLPGWRAVQNLDGHGVSRKIAGAQWNFFFLAGAISATVLGRDRPATMRRAVKAILARLPSRKYNALQIAKVVPRSFLGIPYLRVSAHSRHIQEGMYLVPVQDFRIRDATITPPAPAPAIALVHDEEKTHSQNGAATPQEAIISNS
jgi:hypothetical protein